MTEELLAQANIAKKNIQDIASVLYSIKKIEISDNRRKYKPYLRFLNMSKKKNGKEVQEAAVLLFDGVSLCGTEVPVDNRLLDCLKEHYSERLKEAKAVLDAM